MPLDEFIRKPYPLGLGTSRDVIEKLISGHEAAMLAWDRVTRGEHGRSNPQRDPETGRLISETPKSDNIRLRVNSEKKGDSDYGTSAQAGLRRLEKAATAGNPIASDLLHRVVDPKDRMSVNSACIQMGWRQPTKTIPDTADALSEATVR